MLGNQCSHGVKWGENCVECALIQARETERRYGPLVDAARQLIAEAEAVKTHAEATP
jgi:hypothetical protein